MPASVDLVVHSLDHALMAAETSQDAGVELNGYSAPLAAASLGPGVFLAFFEEAARRFPNASLSGILDCGSDAGKALEALHAGASCISVDLPAPALEKLVAVASQLNAKITPYPKNPLDLATHPLQNQNLQSYLEEHNLI